MERWLFFSLPFDNLSLFYATLFYISMCSWAHLSCWPIRPICRAKMPSRSSLGLSWTKAHLIEWHSFDHTQLIEHATDSLFLKEAWEVTSFSNFAEAVSPVFSGSSHKISLNWVTTSFDGYLGSIYVRVFIKMVGTRSGINTTRSKKKEKS